MWIGVGQDNKGEYTAFVVFNFCMKISVALELLKNDEPIVVRDKTYKPRGAHRAILDTGEAVYWVYANGEMWLSLDPESDEIILFTELDENLEPEDDMVVYGGEDYEFSYEGSVKMEDEESGENYTFKEYESSAGEVLRIMERESTGDMSYHFGMKLTEEDLQEA